jgi:hypothetical protein
MKALSIVVTVLVLTTASTSAQWLKYPTPGIPRTADGKPDLTAPAPRLPDGKPDLSGVWLIAGSYIGDITKDLKAGEMLDGEGGYTVLGRLMPAADSLSQNCLPLGLAHGWKLLKGIRQGQPVRWSDVAFDASNTAVRLRREMEASAAPAAAPRAPAEIAR